MLVLPAANAVDVVPFAARRAWTGPADYEVWWEDPRDLYQIVVRFRPGGEPPAGALHLEYWQSSWPGIRLPKGLLVGSGRSGWLAIDDWTNGRWLRADCAVEYAGDVWSFTFRPLNLSEFPAESEFPATFRHTLKLKLCFDPASGGQAPQAGLDDVRAYTDSEWRELDVAVQWRAGAEAGARDGQLEAYNGSVIDVQPLAGPAGPGAAGAPAADSGPMVAGTKARIRYAHHEDSNSYDRTIVTLVAPGHSFSFAVDDLLAGQPIYVRDLGALATLADQTMPLADFEAAWRGSAQPTLYERIGALPEQTWEAAWAGMPPKRRRLYFVLGCEGSRQKFGVDPNGDIYLEENYIRRVPGADTPRLGWEGRALRFGFGPPGPQIGDRSLLDGYLPIIRTSWTDGGLCYEQEAFATWLNGDMLTERMAGDDPVVTLVRWRITNVGTGAATARLRLSSAVEGGAVEAAVPEALVERDGTVYANSGGGERLRYLLDVRGAGTVRPDRGALIYTLELPAGSAHVLEMKIPFLALNRPAELERLGALAYDEERARVAEFWRQRSAAGAQIETPNATLNDFYRTHVMHMLVINDREPGADRNVARCGGFHYGSYPDEGCMVIADLDRRGYTAEAERCLELYLHYQGTVPLPGNYQSADGVFYGSGGYERAGYNRNQGWVLWGLAEHYRYTRDRTWLERAAPGIVKGCDWIIRERAVTRRMDPEGRRPLQFGFLPPGSLEDVRDYWTWLATNAYAYWGLRAAADVLAEIGHAEAGRLDREAEAYRQDLRAGFFEAATRSPVVRLRNGTWVPHFPPRQERRGRDFGWLREVLEGAAHLIYCGLVDPLEPAARWIIEDYEDNLFLGEGYGYPAPDFERQWFGWGGFSMQPNLLLFPPIYLWRDEPEHFLRGYFNPFAAAFYPDTLMLTEHPLPTLADWAGDHFKTSDEANSAGWLRLMFLAERGRELFVGQAIPRQWFADGLRMRVARALTYFGPASLEIVSHAATGLIVVHLDPPQRNAPERILLRVRHPEREPMQAVWVNGLPHTAFDAEKEVIWLDRLTAPIEVRVNYQVTRPA